MNPEGLVDKFLICMQERDLEGANAFMAPNCKIIFPGGHKYSSLEEIVEAASKRYKWVKKNRDLYFTSNLDAKTRVTSIGTLYGENLYGIEFKDIRYIDVFVIEGDKIVEQLVWNDLAESNALTSRE